MNTNKENKKFTLIVVGVAAGAAFAAVLVTALLMNIFERKAEGLKPFVRLVEVDENTTDPAVWGKNWPKQYDAYLRTAEATRTRFGGHGGSEALPEEKIERDPWLKRMFAGYAFSIDYRDRRGHAYMLEDQEKTQRQTKPQSGSCIHCHASVMPMYRKLGDGDADKGFAKTFAMSYQETNKMLHDMGHDHPVSCVDCHNPKSMEIRVTRPGFIRGIQALAEGDAPVPHLPSIQKWRDGDRKEKYDPNRDASRNEKRGFVCGQCHVEYYCANKMPLTFPWGNGLKVEDAEKFWNDTKFEDGHRFYDYKHKETGAEILKAQHPEFELWSQGIHARSGVTCADCHMPYMREGATKISDHWVRSPLLNVNRSCQTCHHFPEKELLDRVDRIQETNFNMLQRAARALMSQLDAIMQAKKEGATDEQLRPSLELQRKAQWRIDYIAAENSMGFHAPQEASRILGEAIDYARQGEVAALKFTSVPLSRVDPACTNFEGGNGEKDTATTDDTTPTAEAPEDPATQAHDTSVETKVM
ncbi:MAG: ammonia-forming cytochrome c nitrite reductase subunit c552 [Deltaproteobacteria bacterium]|nr:ammonia-forming cytochrome c nitrite reductase subunit c552 [Deltaproteobacteria bacterium]